LLSTPALAMNLMTSAPCLTFSRTRSRTASTPFATPVTPRNSMLGANPVVSSTWPPVAPIGTVATSMRGPVTRPRLMALRSATSMYSSAPTLRTVVNPASSVRLANVGAITAESIGPCVSASW
jgi:hypothetical protein